MGVGKVRNGMFVSLDALEFFFFWGGGVLYLGKRFLKDAHVRRRLRCRSASSSHLNRAACVT